MFKKILVAEDIDSINYAVGSVLRELCIHNVSHAQSCDKAYLMARKAILEEEPYDLLICDLSFKKDFREEKITSGKELVALLKELDPSLKVVIHSIEDHPYTIKLLWKTGNINAYVCKDRSGMKELKEAIQKVFQGRAYNSPGIQRGFSKDNILVLDEFEVELLRSVANGMTQDEIQEKKYFSQ